MLRGDTAELCERFGELARTGCVLITHNLQMYQSAAWARIIQLILVKRLRLLPESIIFEFYFKHPISSQL